MKIFNSALFSSKATALLLAAIALIGTGQLGAQTAVSNLGENALSNGSIMIGSYSGLHELVFSFRTGATAADFTGVSLAFDAASGNPGALAFGLYSTFSTSTLGGTTNQLTALTTSENPLVAGTYSFTGSASLAANTPYYLKISADSASGFFTVYLLPFADTANETGLAGWTIDSAFRFTNGSYIDTILPGPVFSVQATEVSAIPEPFTYAAIMGLGALGFAFWRRQRQASAVLFDSDGTAQNP